MTIQDTKAKGPGQRGRGDRGGGGFSFGDREGGRGGREGREGRGGRDRRGPGGGGASYRVVTELSAVEKALTKNDFAGMKAPLSEILRALKPLHLKSVNDLDLNTRGRLITSLMRVARAPKPKDEAPESTEAAPAEAPQAEAEGAPAEATAEAVPTEGAEITAPAEAAPADGGAEPTAGDTAAPTQPAPARAEGSAWADALFQVGLVWHSVGEGERADACFSACDRRPTDADLAAPAGRPERAERGERAARGERKDRGERKAKGPREERRERPARGAPLQSSGDWQQDAQRLEELGRTRDAGRIHEKNKSHAAAARLFEIGGDLRSALRNAAMGKLDDLFAAVSAKLKPEEVADELQRAQAWEKLMEFHVGLKDFDAIARLYERAQQFDQAGLAWERAGKLSSARKAYERAKDFAGVTRVRDLEVAKLIERGDRLGAATLLVGASRTADALEVLKALPPPKAFHFMEKLKLKDEAEAFARGELAKADAENNPQHRARWLELLGDLPAAADAYLAADRKDKAAYVFERLGNLPRAAELLESIGQLDKAQAMFTKAGDTANAERVAALPRPEPKPKAAAVAAEATDSMAMPPPEAVDTGSEPPSEASP